MSNGILKNQARGPWFTCTCDPTAAGQQAALHMQSFRPAAAVVIHWYKQQTPVHSYYYNKDQFGLQNKHFSGRTSLFNSHIPHGNASLLLKRVKVQDKGRYKCYTSTRKCNQEVFVNLEVKALIQSVVMEMTNEMVTCSSQNIYPAPQVTWATDPPSDLDALVNSTVKTTDNRGLFSVESKLRVVDSLSNYTYFCFFTSADKTQVRTASWKNQEDITQEEGHALSIPCILLHSLQNFSLTWTFTSSTEPRVIIKYDSRTRHTFNLWEGQAELDQDLLLLGNGSLLLHKPNHEEHSGMYTCTFSGLQNRHVIQTHVNITVASKRVDEQSVQRSWWSTAASAAFVLFTIIAALPQCIRQKVMETRSGSHTCNGAGHLEGGIHKDPNTVASYTAGQNGSECNRLFLQFEARDESEDHTPEKDFALASPPESKIEQDEKPTGPPVEGNGGLECSSWEKE
ncbi:hypothetical protein Q5P01_019630 [Channa striata]|uniref:Ig-like domain-containing protein n=1 Tax=Channa striata TaxID=64152 RepID=A0AA88S651_CHASR|nr:hypothetical protein Q5P01_019630 [Channa striata]